MRKRPRLIIMEESSALTLPEAVELLTAAREVRDLHPAMDDARLDRLMRAIDKLTYAVEMERRWTEKNERR